MRAWIAILVVFAITLPAHAQKTISFPTEDGGVIFADLYGRGTNAVVLAHGGQFNKESWAPQARTLVSAGFLVLALDFRGFGNSRGPGEPDPLSAPLHLDVLAAVHYLRQHGAKTISVVGASMGGGAAGDASITAPPGTIDRLVFLGYAPNLPAAGLQSPSLFIVARDDASGDGPRLPWIRKQYESAPQPKATDRPRRIGSRSVSLPNRSGQPRDARNPPLPSEKLNRPWPYPATLRNPAPPDGMAAEARISASKKTKPSRARPGSPHSKKRELSRCARP